MTTVERAVESGMENRAYEQRVTRRRLSPAERRSQLIDIGLQQLITRPGEALSVDQVAERAGISRGLLFRYFATKQIYFAAVAQEMVVWIERRLEIDDHDAAEHRLHLLVTNYLSVLSDHPDWAATVSVADFGVGSEVSGVIMDLHQHLVERTADLLNLVLTAEVGLRLAGWWALVHTVGRMQPDADQRADLVAYCLAVQPGVLAGEAELPELPAGA